MSNNTGNTKLVISVEEMLHWRNRMLQVAEDMVVAGHDPVATCQVLAATLSTVLARLTTGDASQITIEEYTEKLLATIRIASTGMREEYLATADRLESLLGDVTTATESTAATSSKNDLLN